MAEEFAVVIFEKAVEKLIDPIIRHFSYLFLYKSNIKSLTDGVEELQNKKSGVKLSVDAYNRNLQIIGRDVESWLVKVEENEKTARQVLDDTIKDGCLNGWCPSLKQRYVVSRKAVKQLVVVKELMANGEKYTQPAYRALPAGTVASVPTLPLEKFESRISLTKDVIEALKSENFSMIAVCGLGGVGKTTMAKEIRDRAIAENLCDEVAMAVVTENPNVNKIQDELASMLGLELDEKSITDIRGKRLYERLTRGRRTLVILDDVWKKLDLMELGIPFGGQVESKGCKVLITSRDEHVCTAMGTEKKFAVKLLSNTEAWDLFKEKAGIIEETGDLYLIAKKVSKECGRLPLAIVTVGTALNGKEKDDWKDALDQLQKSNVTSIPGMENDLYARLRLSYNLLENNQLRRLFLLCCTYPEDHDIPVEDLIRYSTGMRLFKDDSRMEVIRRRVNSLVNQLKSCYLLLHSDKSGSVKVHDVLRDFGLKEASNSEHVYLVRHQAELKQCIQNDLVEQCTEISISSNEELELPPGLACPLLKRLTLATKGSIQISANYFGGMKGLNVVSFRGQRVSFNNQDTFLESPPKPLQYFMNVRTLCLEHCHFNSDIVFIGSMHKLEVLSFIGSEKIDVLPNEIGQLNNLKVLDLRHCEVGFISSGVLSSLKNLEDLYMGKYFCREGVEERNQGNCASIIELCSLSALKTLQLWTSKAEVSSKLKEFFFDRLILFHISINVQGYESLDIDNLSNRGVLYNVDLSHFIRERIIAFLKTAKVLYLKNVSGWKNVIRDSDEVSFTNLKELRLDGTNELVEILCRTHPVCLTACTLEVVNFENLSAMKNLWSTQIHPSFFEHLQSFTIFKCNAIQSLFSPSVVSCLVQLQFLNILNCEMLENIVSKDETENDVNVKTIKFLKLRKVTLNTLPMPKNFVSNSNSSKSLFNEMISLPSLEILEVQRCSMLSCITPTYEATKLLQNLVRLRMENILLIETVFDLNGVELSVKHGNEEAILGQLKEIIIKNLYQLSHIWRNFPNQGLIQRNSFGKLEKLEVHNCHRLRYIFSASMATLLVNLKELEIRSCQYIEQVMVAEEEEIEKKMDTIVFPKLQWCVLLFLENLKSFYQGSRDLEFPALKFVSLNGTRNMKYFCSKSVSAPEVQVRTSRSFCVWTRDLNSATQDFKKSSGSTPELKEV